MTEAAFVAPYCLTDGLMRRIVWKQTDLMLVEKNLSLNFGEDGLTNVWS